MTLAALVLTSLVSSAQAAPLSRLLGVPQRTAAQRTVPQGGSSLTAVSASRNNVDAATAPRTVDRNGATNVPGQLSLATPRFPILRKAVVLYLLYVLQNPYR